MTKPAAPQPGPTRRARRPDPGGPDNPEAGLTLIEVIVALALGALVVAFLAQGTGLIRRFSQVGQAASAQDETLAVRDHLRRTIESAMHGTNPAAQDYFAGVGDTAVFTVPGDPLLEAGGLVRITLAAVHEGSRMSLVETRAPVGAPDAKGRTRRLVTGATRVELSYFGTMGGSSAWLPEWTDPGTSPALMRIDVAFPRGDRRTWPAFMALIPTGSPLPAPAAAPPAPSSAAATPQKPG